MFGLKREWLAILREWRSIKCAIGYHEWLDGHIDGAIDFFIGCRHCNRGAWLVIDGKPTAEGERVQTRKGTVNP